MSGFVEVRSYFRLNLIALGFQEWKDVFNVDNIPSTKLEKSFHLGPVTGSRRDAYDPNSQDVEAEIVVRIVRKGYKNPADAVDQCLVDLDSVLSRVLAPTRRFGPNVKNVYYGSHTIDELATTNDNVAVLEITFNCLIILCV